MPQVFYDDWTADVNVRRVFIRRPATAANVSQLRAPRRVTARASPGAAFGDYFEKRRVASAMGSPMPNMCMSSPVTHVAVEGVLPLKGAAESGTTTKFMKA